ncbi:MAG: TolC family protein [Leptospiraceae bacterium]|nr:TolC family protein [Leptospiraceae bacterium]
MLAQSLLAYILFLDSYETQTLGSTLQAKQNEARTYTLPQIVSRAEETSELLRAQRLKVASTEAQGRQARAWQNPSLSAELGRLRDTQNNAMTYDFRITQPLFFPGKLAKQYEIYQREKDFLELEALDLQNIIKLEASYYAYAYFIAELKSRTITSRIERISLMRTYMRAQAFASPAKIVQRNIVSNQLIALQKSLNASLAEAESSWQRLNIYLNEPQKIELQLSWLTGLRDIDREKFLAKVKAGNRRLKSRRLLLARLEAELAYQKSVPLPDVSITAFYRREALEIPGANQFYGGAVNIPLPLVNTNRAGIEAAEKRLEAARAESEFTEREIMQTANAVHAEYSQKRKLLADFHAEQIPKLEQQMRYADRELKLGRIDLLSYLELELQTHEAIQAFYDNQLELVRAITQMIHLMGESVEYNGDLYVVQVD